MISFLSFYRGFTISAISGGAVSAKKSLELIQREVISCSRCPRLVEYRCHVAQQKRRAYRDWTYWGKPVPGFGDFNARLLVLGLAPAAHGGNRTGRVFTGDSSGDLLFATLHKLGFSNQPQSTSHDDGLALRDAYVTASVRCAPPGNKPTLEEFRNCRDYLEREIDLLHNLKVVLALGKLAFDIYLSILRDRGHIASRSPYVFSHGAYYQFEQPLPELVGCYHPSRQNTQTGRLTQKMFLEVFRMAKAHL